MIEPGDIVRAHHICWARVEKSQSYFGIILEVRDNALWGIGSARVLCDDEIVRDFGIWEMSPAEKK